jgi:hypothetical protein
MLIQWKLKSPIQQTSGTPGVSNHPPDPVYNNIKVTHALDKMALDAPLWENDIMSVLISKNVSIYIEEEHPNTKGDAVAKGSTLV